MRAILLALVLAAAPAGAERYRDGDIIFHASRSSQSAAIQRATKSRYSHMGMLFHRRGGWYVLEASSTVRYTPIADWIRRGEGGHYVVKRLSRTLSPRQAAALRREAEAFLDRRYDLLFAWGDEEIYCSELVFKAYERALGLELGGTQRLGDFDLSDPVILAKLRERYGDRVPLGETVISPSAVFAAPELGVVEQR